MSNTTSPAQPSAPVDAPLLARCRRLTAVGVRATAFWAAVLLPIAYVPVVTGAAGGSADLFLALLALHVACMVVGHEHSPGRTTNDAPSPQ